MNNTSKFSRPLPDELIEDFKQGIDIYSHQEDVVFFEKDKLYKACLYYSSKIGLSLKPLSCSGKKLSRDDFIKKLSNQNNFEIRRVNITADFSSYDCGMLLAFYGDQKIPCILTSDKNGKYTIFDTNLNKIIKLTKNNKRTLESEAYYFYQPLPDKELSVKNLINYIPRQQKLSVIKILFYQVAISLLMLLVPFISGKIIDLVIPTGNFNLLMQFSIALMVLLFVVVLFSLTQYFLIIRFKLKLNFNLQAAMWSRVLRLPIKFFKSYSVGDLLVRIKGIEQIQQYLTSGTIGSITSGIFSIFSLVFIAFYSPPIAFLLAIYVFFVLLISSIFIYFQARHQKNILVTQGVLTSIIIEGTRNISKLRLAHAEKDFIKKWAITFIKNINFYNRYGNIRVLMMTFIAFISVTNIMLLIGFFIMFQQQLGLGDFIAISGAFTSLLAALFMMLMVLSQIIMVVPLIQRLKPILHAVSESRTNDITLDDFKGKIEFKNMLFHYRDNQNLLFKNFNLLVNEGEFVALTGASGIGKSTLIRLLLGFEEAVDGDILYDDVHINLLNINQLRGDIGVVLQHNQIFPGSIRHNIDLEQSLSNEQILALLQQVELYDDITTMPMGLETQLIDTISTLSLGQRQRLFLARALAGKPKVLLLDEMASGLDNLTQDKIMRMLAKLSITRVMITHRKSTFAYFDRIIAL